jgi:hypothetical protein
VGRARLNAFLPAAFEVVNPAVHGPSVLGDLPPRNSPQLNLIELLWKMLKYYWLKPDDYAQEQLLFYKTTLALAAVGTSLNIHFSDVVLV